MDLADVINKIDTNRFLMILGLPTILLGIAWAALISMGYLPGDYIQSGELIMIGVGMMTYGVAQANKKTMNDTQLKLTQVHEALQNVTLCTLPDADCVYAKKATVEGLSNA